MGYRFLLVDDSAMTRAVIRRVIGMCGVDVDKIIEASNGKDALAMLRVTPVSMVFLDLNMPEMSGMEVVKAVRADAKLAHVPIIIVSSESTESRIEQMKADGVNGYIKKPFTPEQIGEVITNTLTSESQGATHAA